MEDAPNVSRLRTLAAASNDPSVATQVENALSALPHDDKVRLLTSIVNNLRKTRHTEVAIGVAELAHARHPDNAFLVSALATSLTDAKRSKDVVDLVSGFLARVPRGALTPQDVSHLSISLSSGYKGVGNLAKAIEVLEAADTSAENVARTLIELYCNAGRYPDAIRLAQQQPQLNWASAKWYAKALYLSGKRTEAWDVTEPFKDHPQIQQLRGEFQRSDPAVAGPAGRRRAGSKVFVVHGHDNEVKESTARFLEKIGLFPIILHEQPSSNQTVIEKFERYANDVAFAVILLTPDDTGSAARSPDPPRPRARQNVIMELGYFMGKLGRLNVCALYKGEVELPSDYHGVVYIEIDKANAWKTKLAQELVHANLTIELSGLLGA